MFKIFDQSTFKELKKQHNIMALVGNGFDISVLYKYKNDIRLKGKTTAYKDFYEYITYCNLTSDQNILYRKMKNDRAEGKENWSDFENSLHELVLENKYPIKTLEKYVDEFQNLFAKFLNELVDLDFLYKFNDEVRENKWANQTLAHFLEDLNETATSFATNTDHYHLFYFVFFNFNYTFLLDNYLYLDKFQFDPHVFKNADRNFGFYPNMGPSNNPTVWSSYVLCDVIHPHGIQNIPRSMLFGIDIPNDNRGQDLEKRLIKSYWAQYDVKYKSYIEQAELFIIFGMSLGKTDAWWMDEIYNSLFNRGAELIIYMFGNSDKESIKDLFLSSCIRHENESEDNKKIVRNNIHVVTFTDNTTNFLGLKELA